MSKVLVTPRSLTVEPLHPELERLIAAGHEIVFGPQGRIPDADDLRKCVPGCSAWIAGIELIGRDTMELAAGLRVIARHGVGVDAVDLDAAADLGIKVVPSSGSNAQGVAELVILHALSLRRPHPRDRAIDDDDAWARRQGSELNGARVAVIGFGAIGSRVADLFAAFGATVTVHDPYASVTARFSSAPTIADAITGADIVSLHCPPSDAPVIAESELALIAEGATLINTARGSLVDLDAVRNALIEGALGGYGCDAFTTEPPSPHPLWQHPNVFTTPHLGGFTTESVRRSVAMAVDTILATLPTP